MKHRVSVLMRHFRIVLLMMLIPATLWCQGVVLHGNVYEAGSRVPLTGIKIKVKFNHLTEDLREIRVDKGGFFQVVLLPDSEIEVIVENPHFLPFNQRVSTYGKKEGDKVFVSIELGRKTIDRSDDQAHTGH
ncbi:MAG: hypothetical protein HKN76_04355 [Saprospiraceae bacterium]|nr:hypothetical protein [Saprospiraceae bacterium]